METFIALKGYEGYYEVSDLGNVRAIVRRGTSGHNMALQTDKDGYKFVRLSVKGRIKRVQVHRIVAQTFKENPMNKLEVNHLNFDKADNRVCNLEWATPKENMSHFFEMGPEFGKKRGHTRRSKI